MKVLNVSMKPAVKDTRDRQPRKPRVYLWTKDSRPLPDPTPSVRREMLRAVLAHLGYMPHRARQIERRSAWSQSAGCSCGCSPGFVVSTPWLRSDLYADVDRVPA